MREAEYQACVLPSFQSLKQSDKEGLGFLAQGETEAEEGNLTQGLTPTQLKGRELHLNVRLSKQITPCSLPNGVYNKEPIIWSPRGALANSAF